MRFISFLLSCLLFCSSIAQASLPLANINITGSNLTATGDANLSTTGDVNIASVQDSEYHYRETKKKASALAKGFDSAGALGFGSDKNSKHESQTVTNVTSNISGNNVNITPVLTQLL
jgi:hypothetical protein